MAGAQPAPPVDAFRTMLSQPILQVLETEFVGVVGATRGRASGAACARALGLAT
ncbi:MAG: hypothetical protein ACK53A_04815 [Gemmatimonadota bacterium]